MTTAETHEQGKPRIHPDLEPLLVPVGELAHYHRNPRQHDLAVIRGSLQTNGQYRPVVVNRGSLTGRPGEILAGNGTVAAARELGWEHVAVTWVDVDEPAAARIVAVDNRASDLASYDDVVLAQLLQDLPDLEGTGYDTAALDALVAGLPKPPPTQLTDPDDIPEPPEEPICQPGDVWQLGPHRLVCGDARQADVWTQLLGDERPHLLWTDPPYGVAYVGKTAEQLTIAGDEPDPDKLGLLLREAFALAATHCQSRAVCYVTAPPGPLFGVFAVALNDLGMWRQTLIWVKDRFILGHSDYHYRHEPIFYGWTPGDGRHYFIDDRTQDSVWEIPPPKRSEDHPTMKPVELIARALRNSSQPTQLVVDPFAGSGSTLIAAHQEQRTARLIELDPRYCDVICRRWQDHTGQLPTIDGEQVDFT